MISESTQFKKKNNFVLLIILLYIPLSPILHNYFKITTFGLSFWNTLFPISFIFVIFLLRLKQGSFKELFFITLFIVYVFLISALRSSIYNDIFSISGLFFKYWYLIFTPIYFYIFKKTDFNENINNNINKILIIQLLFHCSISILYMLDLPTLRITTDEFLLNNYYTRYPGILGGPNLHSNFILIIATLYILNKKNKSTQKKIFVLIIACIGILSSGSRGPLINLLIISTFLIINTFKQKRTKSILILIPFFFISSYAFMFFDWSSILERIYLLFSEGDSERIEKYALALKLLQNSVSTVLIGVPSEWLFQGVTFSDNAFLQVAVSIGIPGTFLWILINYRIFTLKTKNYEPIKPQFLYLWIIFSIMLTNTSILWFAWTIYAILGFFLISQTSDKLELAQSL